MISRQWRLTSCALSALALFASARDAGAQTPRVRIRETLRGGVTVAGFAVAGNATTLSTGMMRVQLPRGATVRGAILYSGAGYGPGGPIPTSPMPRVVQLGSGATMVTRTLEGSGDFSAAEPTYFAGRVVHHTFATDATTAVRAAIGATAAGGIVSIPIAERGDGAGSDNDVILGGHALVVEYEHPQAPPRHVLVVEGAVAVPQAPRMAASLALSFPGPVFNRCAATDVGFEPVFMSTAHTYDFNDCDESKAYTVNGTTVATRAGGADELNNVRASCSFFEGITGLFTVGSVGARDGTTALTHGAPVGLEGDNLLGVPVSPRFDDELFNLSEAVPHGSQDVNVSVVINPRPGRETDVSMIPVMVFQARARAGTVADGDADGDGVSDVAEGACALTDTDRDGTTDFLDTDSDNDCLTDSNPREVGGARTDPAMPGAADANCPTDRPVCDRSTGTCAAVNRLFFEDWESGATRWTLIPGMPTGAVNLQQESASGCTRFARETQLASGGRYRTNVAFAVDASRQYCLTAWVRGSSGTQPFLGAYPTDMGATMFGAHDWLIGVMNWTSAWNVTGRVTPVTSDGMWRWYASPFRVPVGTRFVGVMTEIFSGGGAGDADFDDIALYEGPCPGSPPTTGPRACPTERPLCAATGARCVACTADAQCTTGSMRVCDVVAGECVECLNDTACAMGQRCDMTTRRCVAVIVDAGPPDMGVPDAGAPDAGEPDAGVPDVTPEDVVTVDATPDAAPEDIVMADVVAPEDAGVDVVMKTDAGADASMVDANADASVTDATVADAKAPDAAVNDAAVADGAAMDAAKDAPAAVDTGVTDELSGNGACSCSTPGSPASSPASPLATLALTALFAGALRRRRR